MSPRSKEFETDVVLDRAIDLFWEKGYEGTSIQGLVERMGIGRASLYDTFGDKHQLFLAALDRYAENDMTRNLAFLEGNPKGLEAIRRFFRHAMEIKDHGCWRGCLLTSAAIEKAIEDPEIGRRVRNCMLRMEDSFAGVLADAGAMGELRLDVDRRSLARYLTTFFQGVVVLAKAQPPQHILDQTVDVGLSVLTPCPQDQE